MGEPAESVTASTSPRGTQRRPSTKDVWCLIPGPSSMPGIMGSGSGSSEV